MSGAKLGERVGVVKLTDPGGGAARAPAAAPQSPAIVSAAVTTMASRRLPPRSTEWEPIRPHGLSPLADTWNHVLILVGIFTERSPTPSKTARRSQNVERSGIWLDSLTHRRIGSPT